jgi:hypothetical protein
MLCSFVESATTCGSMRDVRTMGGRIYVTLKRKLSYKDEIVKVRVRT